MKYIKVQISVGFDQFDIVVWI